MVLTLVADATAYAALLFGGLFLWVSAPGWPVAGIDGPDNLVTLTLTLCVLAGVLIAARRSVVHGSHGRIGWLVFLAAAHGAAAMLFGLMAYAVAPLHTGHALFAVIFAVYCYAGLHALLGALFALYGIWRVRGGYVSPARDLDLRLGARFHAYAAVAGILAVVFVWQFAMLGTGGDAR